MSPVSRGLTSPVYRGIEKDSSLNPFMPGVGIFPERRPLPAMDAPK